MHHFDEKTSTLKIQMMNLRAQLSERFQIAIDRESSPIASALFLGDRSDLTGDTVLNFRRCGISHLLALSGMHISVVILMWEILLRRLKISKLCRAAVVPALAIFYLMLTGCASSTFRAVLMLCIMYLAYLFSSDYDGFTALCISLFLILKVSPYAVADTAMWMSFIATAGILIFVPAVSQWLEEFLQKSELPKWIKRCIRLFVTAVTVGLFANAAMLPFLAYFYGEASLFSIGMTLILSPILSLALPLCMLTLALPWCRPIVWLTQFVLRIFLFASSKISDLHNTLVLLNGNVTIALTAVLAFLLILFALIRLVRRGWLLLPLALSFAVLTVAYLDRMPADAGVSVSYLCNLNEEALVLAEGRTAIAIDMSDGSGANVDPILNAVLQSKCTELQELVLTHYHSQSARLIASLSSSIKLRAVRLPAPSCKKECDIAMRLEQEARLHGIDVVYGTDGLPLEQVCIRSLDRLESDDRVEVPVILSLEIGESNLVYLGGDAWSGEKEDLARNYAISADYLILGSHGAWSVPSEGFILDLPTEQYVIFGNEALFHCYPQHRIPVEYAVAVSDKQFYLK